jgi:hypothetical protein
VAVKVCALTSVRENRQLVSKSRDIPYVLNSRLELIPRLTTKIGTFARNSSRPPYSVLVLMVARKLALPLARAITRERYDPSSD